LTLEIPGAVLKMLVTRERERPESWPIYRERIKHPVLRPLFAFEWGVKWLAYVMGGWVVLELLEYLGTLSILFAAVSFFAESGNRVKQKHYQAWQVINTAQGKGGSGGRIDAMQELLADGVPLVGVDVSGAFLQGISLDGADLTRANFQSSDVRDGSFQRAQLQFANVTSANFRAGSFRKADLRWASLKDADLVGADLSEADLEGVDLSRADLRNTNLQGVKWDAEVNLRSANVFGVKNPPAGFLDFAKLKGAVSMESEQAWNALLEREP
jgi:uncharacterized protein YjbI with pentapeptide repeats